MSVKLVEFLDISEDNYVDYIVEWENSGEKIVPYASRRDKKSFSELQNIWKEDKTDKVFSKGFVPASLYFLINDNGRILGAIYFRHELNKQLLQDTGHIGYGVRPSVRGKGYANIMLRKLLEILKTKDYDKVLITCDDDNLASAGLIEKNNGILENKLPVNGVINRRYWINLEP